MITQAVGEAVDLSRQRRHGDHLGARTASGWPARPPTPGSASSAGSRSSAPPASSGRSPPRPGGPAWSRRSRCWPPRASDTVVLCTGGRTEKGAMKLLPDLPEVCFVEVGDFTGAALRRAGRARPQPGGLRRHGGQAHQAGRGRADDPLHPVQGGPGPARQTSREPRAAPEDLAEQVANANTARHAAELWDQAGLLPEAGRELCARAARVLSRFAAEAGGPRNASPRRSASSWSTSPASRRSPRPRHEQQGVNPQVTVIGCDGRPFGPEAADALAAAERVIGAPRHLDAAPVPATRGTHRAQAPRRGPRRPRRTRRPHRRAGLRRPRLLRHRPRAARPRHHAARHPGRLLGRARLREDRPGLGRRPGRSPRTAGTRARRSPPRSRTPRPPS